MPHRSRRLSAFRAISPLLVGAAALSTLALAPALAQEGDQPVHRRATGAHVERVAERPLTVHRRLPPPVPFIGDEEDVDVDLDDVGPGFVRAWNDPRLDTFWGWRLGGDNFYGDLDGSPITRGNAGLGMISGYGPARGGYGGPHFDSVGGFHNGPGPGAREAADYASGSISRPVYNVPLPRYPSLKERVADLDTGLAGTGQVHRAPSTAERWSALAQRARYVPAPPAEDDEPDF